MNSNFRSKSISLRRQSGLTLIELMIAMVLNLIIIGGGMTMMSSAHKSYRVDEAVGHMQDAMRFSQYILGGKVREAGFGCLDSVSEVVSTLNDSTKLDYSFESALQGYDSTLGYPEEVSGEVVAGSDVLVVRSATGTSVTLESEMPDTSAALKTTVVDPAPITGDDIVVLTDCASAAVFQVTNYTDASGTIVHNTGNSTTPGNATKSFGHSFKAGSKVMKVHTTVYYLGTDDDDNKVLYERANNSGVITTTAMLYGMDDIQITYGVNSDTSKGVDEYLEANAVTDWDNVISVRFELLFTSVEDNLVTKKQTYTYNGSDITADDTRIYRPMSFVTAMRNRTE